MLLLWSRVGGWVFRRERLSIKRSLLHILRRPCDLLVRRWGQICWARGLLIVPAFHSFNWFVTRSQARKSSCTKKSSISPPDGRLKTDAMEWFPAYVGLYIAHAHCAHNTAADLARMYFCDVRVSEKQHTPHKTPLWLESSGILSLVSSMTDLLEHPKVNQNGCTNCLEEPRGRIYILSKYSLS